MKKIIAFIIILIGFNDLIKSKLFFTESKYLSGFSINFEVYRVKTNGTDEHVVVSVCSLVFILFKVLKLTEKYKLKYNFYT